MPTVAESLAERVTSITFKDLPDDVVAMGKRCVLDLLGVQVAGATFAHIRPALELTRQMGGVPKSTIVVHGDRSSPSNAAYVNSAFGHSCEFDDISFLAGHPGVCTIPVAFALAEADGETDGRELLAAIVAGYEATVLSCAVIYQVTLKLGWHAPKVSGVFGAAATAAKVLGLTLAETTNALSIAGSDASGTMEYDQSGGEVKRLHPALAARAGLEAAFLARLGMTGPSTIFEGRRGIWALFGDGSKVEPYQHWDRSFHIRDTMFKLYPSAGIVHAPLDALRTIQAAHNFSYKDVREVRVGVADWSVPHMGTIYEPTDSIGAQFSLPFSMALQLVRMSSDDVQPFQDPAAWSDPILLQVAQKVSLYAYQFPPGAPDVGAQLDVVLSDGTVYSHYQATPRGHVQTPATDEDISRKFYQLATPVLGRRAADRAVEAVDGLDSGATAGDVMRSVVRE